MILLVAAAFLAAVVCGCGGGGGGGTTSAAPAVASVTPANNAVGVSAASVITATFNTDVLPASVTTASFSASVRASSTALPGTVTVNGRTATLTLASAMPVNTAIVVTITTAVTSTANMPMVQNYVWSFTTGSGGPAPTVVSTVPASRTSGVSLTSNVTATFSEAINPTTITSQTFTLASPSGAVPATVGYANDVATLTPTSQLLPNTTYTATVTTGVQSSSGTPMASTYQWTFTTAPGSTPTVISTTPANNATQVGVKNSVTATFSKAMNATTINGTTFTLTGRGSSPVTATVTYAGSVATLTPAAALGANTTYTATITTGAADTSGNHLASNFVWTFTTGQAGINLGTAASYGAFAGSSVTNTGATSITGDLGVSPGTAVTGFPPGTYTGSLHAGDSVAATAKANLQTAYDYVEGLPGAGPLASDISGHTITPGLYINYTSVALDAGSTVTFDAKGDPNAVFILQVGSTLTTGTGSTITLANGAQAGNIYWALGSTATLGATSSFMGTILTPAAITANNGAAIQGRLLTTGGTVSLSDNSVVTPPFNPAKRK